jgi:glycosyltransferase involved in cell wall biosynthesis
MLPNESRKVLVVVGFFPHSGGSRTDKFVKYLPEFGWQPFIATTKESAYSFSFELLQEYPTYLRIYRAGVLKSFSCLRHIGLDRLGCKLNDWILIPDEQVLWVLPAFLSALRVVRKENIRVVFTTSPSESCHLVGLLLKKTLDVKWVADFRDLWTDANVLYHPKSSFHDRACKQLEAAVFQLCDMIVTVTDGFKRWILKHGVTDRKVCVIQNGYDSSDFAEYNPPRRKERDGTFNIGYFGSIETLNYPYREFFEGFRQALLSQPGMQIQLNMWTSPSADLKKALVEKCLHRVIFHEIAPHKMVTPLMQEQDVLLVMLSYRYDCCVPQKLYNYIGARRPILALVPKDSEAAAIIRKTRSGIIVEPNNVDGIANAILSMYEKWHRGGLDIDIPCNGKSAGKYERRRLTGELAIILGTGS